MQPVADAARNAVLLNKRLLSPAVGVEIEGIDLSQPLDRTTIEAILRFVRRLARPFRQA